MSLLLKLPAKLEARLSEEAAENGLPLEAYVLRLLDRGEGQSLARTGKELVDYWRKEGLIGSRPDITDSSAHARMLREKAQRRSRS
jgi:hypothetical protein